MRIIFGIKFMGGANAVLPVAKEALKNKDDITVFADTNGPAYAKLASSDLLVVLSNYAPDKFLDFFKPDAVVVSSMCTNDPVNLQLLWEAKKRSIKTVLVEDFWGDYGIKRWHGNYPDLICVQDAFAKDLVLSAWSGYIDNQVRITGQPGFDCLHQIDRQEAKKNLRKKFNLHFDCPIIYFSGFEDGMTEALSITVDALNEVDKPVYFFLRHHPRVLAPNAPEEVRKIPQACQDITKKLRRGWVLDSMALTTTEEVYSGADMVVGTLDSVSLIEACYLGIPCVAIQTETRRKALSEGTDGLLSTFPLCRVGACLEGSDMKELKECFSQILSGNTTEMLTAQKSYCLSDGQSASRVYAVIKE